MTSRHWRKDLVRRDVAEPAEWCGNLRIFEKLTYTYTVSEEKSPNEDTIWDSSSCKWQFLSEPMRVLAKQWKGKIRGSWVQPKFTGIQREGRGHEVYKEDGKKVTWWQILFQYKKQGRIYSRGTKSSEFTRRSEVDCYTVSNNVVEEI